jgi:lambda repressor-like predicted transcriptional regulator
MTELQRVSKDKFGSLRKMARKAGISESSLFLINSGHRKAWPKLRRQIAEAVDMPETELFDTDGWLKEVN